MHARIWCLGLEGNGVESLGGDDPRLMLLQELGIGLSSCTVLLDEPPSDGPRHPSRAVVGRGGILSVTILRIVSVGDVPVWGMGALQIEVRVGSLGVMVDLLHRASIRIIPWG